MVAKAVFVIIYLSLTYRPSTIIFGQLRDAHDRGRGSSSTVKWPRGEHSPIYLQTAPENTRESYSITIVNPIAVIITERICFL